MDRGYDREFIIVDKTKLSGEEDQFKDATVFYHHPHKTMADVSHQTKCLTKQSWDVYFYQLPHIAFTNVIYCVRVAGLSCVLLQAEVVNKYSQLVGLATLHYHWFGTFPAYIKLLPVGCAVRQLGQKHLMVSINL